MISDQARQRAEKGFKQKERARPAAFMGAANRSPSHIEPVSRMPKRKLENGEQRLAPQSHQSSPDIPEFAGQRLRRASLTRGNTIL